MRINQVCIFTFFILFTLAVVSSAQQPARYWDNEVKRLIEEAVESSDDFQDEFERVKSITTMSGVQVNVEQYLEDYEDLFKRFRDDFDANRIPDTDLVNLLHMTNELDAIMARNPDAAGAGSEWQAHRFNVERLAQAFRTSLNASSVPPRRLSDDQIMAVLEQMVKDSKSLEKSVKDAVEEGHRLNKNTQDAAEHSFKYLQKKIETMSELFEDRKPFYVELQDVFGQMNDIRSIFAEYPMNAEVQSYWRKLENNAAQLAFEFGYSRRT